jgi:DNA polymerase-3 subunit beta
MKAHFNRTALAEALGLLTSIVPSRTPKPILRCIRITAEEKQALLSATDLEVGVNYLVSGLQVEQTGGIAVPADRLNAIVRESTDDVLTLEATEGTCKVTGADSEFTIYGQKPEQYPAVPVFEGEADMQISLLVLQGGIEQCLFATAKESSRYAINGVLWEAKGKKLLLVATDGRRLARCRVSLLSAPPARLTERDMIVPAKTMALLSKITGGEKDRVAVKLVDNQVLFSCGDVVISSALVEGNFPKYEDIIPSGYTKKLTLPTEGVLSAVRRAALLTSEESRGIKLAVNEDGLVFSARAPEAGDSRVSMSLAYKAEPIQIGFNPQFLVDALRVMHTPEFELELGEPDRPGLIKSGTEFLYVLMPISLA